MAGAVKNGNVSRRTSPAARGLAAAKSAATPLPASSAKKKTAEPANAPELPSSGKPAKAERKPPRVRPVLVRDGFTMPEADFALIATLKSRALAARRHAKKSELLRAGLRALVLLDGQALVEALDRLEPVKIGRPGKGH